MLRKRAHHIVICFVLLFVLTTPLAAQRSGGTLWGVTTSEGKPLAGVSIEVSSDALLQSAKSSTDSEGRYGFSSLPPGTYQVHFEKNGMTAFNKPVVIHIGDVARVDADLKVSDSDETITLTASASPAVTRSALLTVIDDDAVRVLPVGHSVGQRIEPLVAGVWPLERDARFLNINGGKQNEFIVDGTTLLDDVASTAQLSVIDDAVAEIVATTAAASVEYGRFDGGVIAIATKSGGNAFTGSARATLEGDRWRARTDFRDPVFGTREPRGSDRLNTTFEETLGGRIVTDRVWFFTAAHQENSDRRLPLGGSGGAFTAAIDDTRFFGKVSAALAPAHIISGSFSSAERDSQYVPVRDAVDLARASSSIDLAALHYDGRVNGFDVQAHFANRDVDYDVELPSPPTAGIAPLVFDAAPRRGSDASLSVSRFLSTARSGVHTLLAGIDEARDRSDASTRIESHALFVSDRWDASNHLSLDFGARYDDEDRAAASVQPRLGAIFDLAGDGRQRFSAHFGRYSSTTRSGDDRSRSFDEWTTAYGLQIGGNGFVRLAWVNRDWRDSDRRVDSLQLQTSYNLLGFVRLGADYAFCSCSDAAFVGRHRLNAWIRSQLPARYGSLDLALLERYHSAAMENSAFGNVSATDVAVHYELPILRFVAQMRLDVLNVFNQSAVEYALTPTGASIFDGLGNIASADAYQTPRSVRVDLGVRF